MSDGQLAAVRPFGESGVRTDRDGAAQIAALTLYYDPQSCAPVSRMALEEAGADYELVYVELAAGTQRTPEYLALNPKGRVPALGTPHGVLTENPAILAYIATTFPEAGLAPLNDPWEFARMQSFNAFISSSIHPAFAHIGRAYRYADDPQAQEAIRAKAPEAIRELFAIVEGDLLPGPWLLGERFSAADIYLCNFVRAARRFDWFGDFPRVGAHLKAMQTRPSYAAVYEDA